MSKICIPPLFSKSVPGFPGGKEGTYPLPLTHSSIQLWWTRVEQCQGGRIVAEPIHCILITTRRITSSIKMGFKRGLYQSVTNIFEYSNFQIFLIQIFIRTFVRIIFWIQIYSDIRSCQLLEYEYIRIFVRSKILIRIYSDLRSYQFSDSDNDFV